MLFNSYVFIFAFLPVTLLLFYRIGGMGRHRIAIAALVGASLFFYGWWNPAYLGLIVASILFNYGMGVALSAARGREDGRGRHYLAFGVLANLAALGYFKYANFFLTNVNTAFGTDFNAGRIILPLAISFFTFQQIAFLVDAHRGEAREYDFLHYCLFVTFFPQLIAGPIVHHRQMFPQFEREDTYRFKPEHLAVGLAIFTIGLFKKAVVADGVAVYATPVFDAALRGDSLGFFTAWAGALSYTLQLYFDFSGYSDMAVGLAFLFGIRIPLNFFSPLKAASIIDFWRRWHISLSHFLRDYVYIPLGGNRRGTTRRYANVMVTMVLGGLWHGAAWTFVLWGALHGGYLLVNHLWRAVRRRTVLARVPGFFATRWLARGVTFLAVVVAFVFFRAGSLDAALGIVQSMFLLGHPGGLTGWLHLAGALVSGQVLPPVARWDHVQLLTVLGLVLACWVLPNTRQLFDAYHPTSTVYRDPPPPTAIEAVRWQPRLRWAVLTGVAAAVSVLCLSRISEFLYFQF